MGLMGKLQQWFHDDNKTMRGDVCRDGRQSRRGFALIRLFVNGLGALAAAAAAVCAAQPASVRPVRMVVGYSPGGGVDFFARVLSSKLSDTLKQQCIVDNRPGAGTNIASEIVARSVPDGHTLLVNNIAFAVSPVMSARLNFDPERDFAGVSQIATSANALVVHPSVAVASVAEFISLAKTRPRTLNYGSAGNGSSTHLAAELFKSLAGVDIVHVPFRGAAGAVTAILSGEVQVMFASLPTALPQVRAGRVRALGVTGKTRSRAAPELPTVAESGLPGFEMSSWIGIMGPAGMPAERVRRLNAAIGIALQMPDVSEHYAREGAEAVGSGAAQFQTYVNAEIVRWGRILKQAGIRGD